VYIQIPLFFLFLIELFILHIFLISKFVSSKEDFQVAFYIKLNSRGKRSIFIASSRDWKYTNNEVSSKMVDE